MDVFRFHNPTAPTKLEQGEIINGLKSKMWIERYREAGEFRFVAEADPNIREKLPIGSLISHTNTSEVMIVEDHQISEEKGQTTDIVITGRGFETWLDNRVVGSNRNFPNVGTIPDYVLSANYTWVQAVSMLTEHIDPATLIDDYDALPYVSVTHEVAGTGPSVERSIQRGSLYERLLELLSVDNLGLKTVRPGFWSPVPGSPNLFLVVHVGVDRTAEVVFSHDTGEIESAEYLWSNRSLKNSALVSGRWVEVRVDSLAQVEFNRRTMYVDASDIDEQFEEAPTGTELNSVIVKMEQRGAAALAAQNQVALTKTEVSREGTRAKYREDFNVGDLITVVGDYNETTVRRVSEYVEIEDETGQNSYPTLTVDE